GFFGKYWFYEVPYTFYFMDSPEGISYGMGTTGILRFYLGEFGFQAGKNSIKHIIIWLGTIF
ncbi:MAG: hypothetical protein AAF575_07085, partial [Bacteroidota bacterium]